MVKISFIFPGQGSQFVGMGQDFYEAHAWAKEIFDLADEVTGKPIAKLCFEGPLEELTLTVNLQPALTAVNLICLKALAEKGITPDATAGHSLGEYSALAAAGVISTADTLKLVNSRGELMNREAERRPGAMQAIIGLEPNQVEEITTLAGAHGIVGVANYNTPQQTVITGEAEAVAAAAKFAAAKRARTVPLAVSGAWHSPLMDAAAEEFTGVIMETSFSKPACDLYLNVTAQKETDPDQIQSIMTRQITSTVRWFEIVENMMADGVTHFAEVGPKKVLAGLHRKIVPRDAEVITINIQDMAGLEKVLESLG
ncbi:MAG: ACP S-malonyltransferase [Deltaproteobacteria bacterium]|nr:ACP S-malonyltransferase [Deltaproteobacteria bacterium]MBW2052330.1 ACP S-malonyltransferase [Deltaproteobacteria bacterium]MBW2140217.1 ACP S-malonyltransferase [Deltaproteobacteria bacterium]MBW2323467.1 ACP S-malonyltransferase [Deltaproteobacteria bacterium]